MSSLFIRGSKVQLPDALIVSTIETLNYQISLRTHVGSYFGDVENCDHAI